MIPKTELADINRHDHDAEAEDRPTPEQHFHEIDLASVIIDKTIVEYRCATSDNIHFTDHNFQTRRETIRYPMLTSHRWIDPEPFDTALDALESASMYLNFDDRLTMQEIRLYTTILDAKASLTELKLARKGQA